MKDERIIWSAARSALESSQKKNRRNGSTGVRHWELFEKLLFLFIILLKIFRLYEKGIANGLSIRLNKVQLSCPNLPGPFDHLKILHLTDLHIDGNPSLLYNLKKQINEVRYDLCVLTGDYRMENHGSIQKSMELMSQLSQVLNAPMGTFATLGNHDSYRMLPHFKEMGITTLTNETIAINKENETIYLTGVDDVHYYYTDSAMQCMEDAPEGFKIALVHSPEMYDIARDNNYQLYFCGHTHGGQICLPGGMPVFKHLYNGEKYIRGLWKVGNMQGYTSEGCGTSGIPLRFNSAGEITLFELITTK